MPPAEAAGVREAEQREAAGRVGVRDVEFLDHSDGAVRANERLRADLVAALRRHRPQLVVVFNHHERTGTGRWNAPDHREFGRCALDAVADAGNRWILPEAGEPWSVKYLAVATPRHPPTPLTSPPAWTPPSPRWRPTRPTSRGWATPGKQYAPL
ncbi:hypothetical protein SHIRM173S_10199 [Streptomyces hirsutus]